MLAVDCQLFNNKHSMEISSVLIHTRTANEFSGTFTSTHTPKPLHSPQSIQ